VERDGHDPHAADTHSRGGCSTCAPGPTTAETLSRHTSAQHQAHQPEVGSHGTIPTDASTGGGYASAPPASGGGGSAGSDTSSRSMVPGIGPGQQVYTPAGQDSPSPTIAGLDSSGGHCGDFLCSAFTTVMGDHPGKIALNVFPVGRGANLLRRGLGATLLKGGDEAADAANGARLKKGSPVVPESGFDWALTSAEQRAATIVRKYGINLRGSGRDLSVRFNPDLPLGTYGRVRKADPTTIEFGRSALASEADLATTLAHELRHARAYLGSGSNAERAARSSEAGLRGFIQGLR
jgi:hypothetical protein